MLINKPSFDGLARPPTLWSVKSPRSVPFPSPAAAASPGEAPSPEVRSPSIGSSTVAALPTLQRNALRKLLDRPDFTPAEVAELGFRRLQLARGLGCKGLDNVLAWLRYHGHELEPLPTRSGDVERRNRRIQQAIHLLRSQGFIVLPGGEARGHGARGKPHGSGSRD